MSLDPHAITAEMREWSPTLHSDYALGVPLPLPINTPFPIDVDKEKNGEEQEKQGWKEGEDRIESPLWCSTRLR